jgi:phosphocarrier protein
MKCCKVTIVNRLGLHARASAKLVSLASGFKSEIALKRDTQQVNAKSIMGIMMLAAAQGTELELCADGRDEAKALAELSALIRDRFGEDA